MRIAFPAFLCLAALAGLAEAQSSLDKPKRGVGTGSLIPGHTSGQVQSIAGDWVSDGSWSATASGEALAVGRKSSGCAFQAQPDAAIAFLENPGSDTALNRFMPALEKCLTKTRAISNVKLQLSRRLAYGLTADAFLSAREVPDFEGASVKALYDAPVFQAMKAGIAKTAYCLANTSPDLVGPVFKTVAGTQEEAAAIRNLVPLIGGCTDSGAQVSLKPHALRLELAIAYYWLTQHSTGQLSMDAK